MKAPAGTDLPAILLGWEIPRDRPLVDELLPEWFVEWEHGYGGHIPDEYDPVVITLAGALLPLERNLRHATGDLRGFIARLRENDDRAAHFHTRDGDPLAAPRLLDFRKALSGSVRVPEVAEATEALARLTPADPLHHFEGWAMHDGAVFDELAAGELAAAGKRASLGAPGAWLAWWNCDL